MPDVTAILTAWKRPYLKEQLQAIQRQSIPARQLFLLHFGDYVDTSWISGAEVEVVRSLHDFGIYARFTLPLLLESEFTWIVDDDMIPGPEYLKNALRCYERYQALIGGGGSILESADFSEVRKVVFYRGIAADTEVDIACNSYFFPTRWIQHFWSWPPLRFDNGEDIHLSASLALAGIRTFVPQQEDEFRAANIRTGYGKDSEALWRRADHFEIRREQCRKWVSERQWRPMLLRERIGTGRRHGKSSANLR